MQKIVISALLLLLFALGSCAKPFPIQPTTPVCQYRYNSASDVTVISDCTTVTITNLDLGDKAPIVRRISPTKTEIVALRATLFVFNSNVKSASLLGRTGIVLDFLSINRGTFIHMQ